MATNLIILQEEKKTAEEKAKKESELAGSLKIQLEEKLTSLKKKNQKLLNLQWKINEQEMRIFDLHIRAEKNKKLEPRLQEAMKTNKTHKKAIKALRKQVKQEQDKVKNGIRQPRQWSYIKPPKNLSS